MANVVAFMCVIAAVSATYPPQPSNQPQAPPPPPPPPQPAATAPHTYPSAVQSPPPQQPQGYQPPVRAPVITVYQQSQSPSQQQQQQQQQTHGVGNSQAAPSSGGSKLKEILYILPIIQSIDRIQDSIPSLPSGYNIQNQASSGQQQQQQQQQQGYMQHMHYSSSTQQQQQQQQQQQVSGADVNSRTSYGQVNSAMSPVGGQMPSYGSLMAMMASQSAPEAGYGAQSVAPAASHIQLPSSYGSGSSQTSGYDLGSSGSGYASQQQQQQQQQMTGYGSASGYGSNQQMVAGSQQMASGYGLAQMSAVPSAVEVGVALKPVLNQQSQYPTISYSQLNNEPKHQQVEVYLATDGQTQGGYEAAEGYESGPNAFDLCEKGFNLDGFCKGKYAGLYSHPNPQCFIQCDQFETHTTSLCAPGTVWLNTGYEPSAVNQCLHSANGITGAH